jgi:hypothetical protein
MFETEQPVRTNPLKEGALTDNSAGIGTVTAEMVQARAEELAIIDGRSAKEVTPADLDQAHQHLTGTSDQDPEEAALESATESDRGDTLPGSDGHPVPVAPSEDEDEEGRSDNERLVNEGLAEAALDQMRQASKIPT